MSIDSMTLATRRNRVHRSSLELELRRLGKEQQNEVRMLNNEKQKFKAKYSSKLDLMLDKKSNDVSLAHYFLLGLIDFWKFSFCDSHHSF